MHTNANALNWDQVVNETEATDGTLTELPLPLLGALTLGTGLHFAATGAGIVGVGASMTNFMGLVWNATADTGDVAYITGCSPGNMREVGASQRLPGSTHIPEFQLQVLARKLDTTGSAAENATLALTADMYWLYSDPNLIATTNNDTALQHLTSPAAATLDAKAVATAEESFMWYTLDIGARLQAETKVLKRNSAFQISLSVSAAVGAALAVEVIAAKLRYRTHPALVIRGDRTRTNLRGSLATGLAGTAATFVSNI